MHILVHNRNAYEARTSLVIASHLSLSLIPLVAVAIPLITGSNCIKESIRGSCSMLYANIYIEIFNLNFAFAFASPVLLNICVIYACAHHIQLKSPLHKTQNFTTAGDKYDHSLIIQFLIFCMTWLLLWSPNIIFYQISLQQKNASDAARLHNFIRAASDPIIIRASDVCFWRTWKKFEARIKRIIFFHRPNGSRVGLSQMDFNTTSVKTPRHKTTTF
ncbi:unnamed protein product [Rotaria magnacalcarata]|uniref:G-protein coupled receptors family 1 profile domain-containing protein n=1 Tax=Rotaria magnacalcarata TaxID=392030 RepID=A0A819UBM9_9BILA|nr:unnamed protein product [Rotaria magnacalcarata]CAF2203805.1 unnamed protein product [Rotaria magnacalcarata]CAF4092573.1 unnamed protein product [Rotaria magnacalcarata]CAF4154417.1 unnamed protein product [Rotaria magnacalcarata]